MTAALTITAILVIGIAMTVIAPWINDQGFYATATVMELGGTGLAIIASVALLILVAQQ